MKHLYGLLLAFSVMFSASAIYAQDTAAPEPIDILFVGDSITDFWDNSGIEVYKKYYDGPRKVINIGVSGDITEVTLKRLDQPRVANIKPTCIQLMIGTNDIGWRNLPPETAISGIKAILAKLQTKWPEAKILLLAVFPRDAKADGVHRPRIATINAALPAMADGKKIFYKDINRIFLDENDNLLMDLMPDALHPNAKGYQAWAEAVEPVFKDWLGK